MKKYFEEQLAFEDSLPLTKEKLEKLKGKSLYSEYKEGDTIVAFLEQEFGDIEPPYTEPAINLTLRMVADRELDKLKEDFKFIRMSQVFPVLERIKK